MSEHALALIIALGVATLGMAALRINAALVFLSLALGAVLVSHVAPQAIDLMRLITPRAGQLSASTLQVILLAAPAVATAVVTLFSVHGRLRNMANIGLAAAASAFCVLLAVPLLPPDVIQAFEAEQLWKVLSRAEALIVGGGATVSLFFLWSQRRSLRHHDKRRH